MIAVLLATYNGEKYLAEQLDSLLNQTLQNFVVCIHDDGSTDNTISVIERYVDLYPNKIKCIEGVPTGSSTKNFFYLLSKVEADYYMFCDQDDYWLPQKIEKSFQLARKLEQESEDEAVLVFSDIKVVDENKHVIDESFMHYNKLDPTKLGFNWLVVENCAPGCTMLFNAKARNEALKYQNASNPEAIPYHDWWLAIVVSAKGNIAYIDTPLMLYRQHGTNVVGAVKDSNLKNIFLRIWWLISMSHIKATKERIRRFVLQGSQLNVLDIEGDVKSIVDGFCTYYRMNKFQRLSFLLEYRLFRTKRNLWQLLCA